MSRPTYIVPPEVKADRQGKAARRRKALVDAGCATYEMGCRNGESAIQCLCCGLGSHNPNDVTMHYCGFCVEFHNEWMETSKG